MQRKYVNMLASVQYVRLPQFALNFALMMQLGLATACNAAEHPEKLLQSAAEALNSKKYAEAAKLAKEASAGALNNPSIQQHAGEVLFLAGDAQASLPCFERANKLNPAAAPRNWQRGVALGCAGKFAEGAEQFRIHQDVNPDDVENSAWYFLCVAKSKGLEAARSSVIPSQGDPRPPMMSVLKMLRGSLTPDEVLKAAKTNPEGGATKKMALFNGFLYVGLYYDSIGDSEKAISALDQSIAVADADYMGRTAQIYRDLRFPKSSPAPDKSPSK